MKVLWLAPYPLWPLNNGGRLRTYNLARRVAAAGHQVEVWCISEEQDALPDEPQPNLTFRFFRQRPRRSLQSKIVSGISLLPTTAWVLRASAVRDAIRKSKGFDLALVEQAQCGALSPELDANAIPWVLDAQNLEWWLTDQMSRQMTNPVTRLRLSIDALRFKRLERRLVSESRAVVAVSHHDAAQIKDLATQARVEIHPNGVDSSYFAFQDHAVPRGANLVMTGTLGYYPNLDASLWFAREVMPKVRARIPQATLTLVGAGVTPQVRAMDEPAAGIHVVGAVTDVRPYLADSDVFVIPLRLGSGTRLKALEALASGLPIVATRLAVEGLGLEERNLALIGESADELSEAVARALQDRSHRASVAEEGRRYVVDFFDWERIAGGFVNTLERAAG